MRGTLRAAQSHLARARAVRVSDYTYHLPPSLIADRPTRDRASSRLFIPSTPSPLSPPHTQHAIFRSLPSHLPPTSRLVYNASRTVPARLPMRRPSGARAEVFVLGPACGGPPGAALAAPLPAGEWRVLLGGRRVRAGDVLEGAGGLRATVLARGGGEGRVRFEGRGGSVLDALRACGRTPLPPYLRREPDEEDRVAYDTVRARDVGSVAAPTAGLHLTEEVWGGLEARGVRCSEVVLHVGAGTFLPVDAETMGGHRMHEEHVSVCVGALRGIADDVAAGRPVVAVGTTTVRTLETLYWHGVRLLAGRARGPCALAQFDAYALLDALGERGLPGAAAALRAVLADAEACGVDAVHGVTSMLIVPGVDALVTNFHQPRSTLLLLVAAFCGGRGALLRAYGEAVRERYRFLSYGDSSLYFNADAPRDRGGG